MNQHCCSMQAENILPWQLWSSILLNIFKTNTTTTSIMGVAISLLSSSHASSAADQIFQNKKSFYN